MLSFAYVSTTRKTLIASQVDWAAHVASVSLSRYVRDHDDDDDDEEGKYEVVAYHVLETRPAHASF